jgi:hypothetical protein
MPSWIATSMPCATSVSRSGSTRPSLTSTASVTISTRRKPNWPMFTHRRRAAPGPTNATGRGIATARVTGHMNGLSRR